MLESRFNGTAPGVARLKSAYFGGSLGLRQWGAVDRLNDNGFDLTFVPEYNQVVY